MAYKILEIKHLQVDFKSETGTKRAVNDISLELHRGETLGIVGESGSGKSVTALSVMQLLPKTTAQIKQGSILYTAKEATTAVDLLKLPAAELRAYRGAEIAMIFQEPMSSLNPVFRCGMQVTEAIQLHQNLSFSEAKSKTLQLFEQVKLPDPLRIFNAYPHEISGGQKQRVMIAMAMSCLPAILIADEPTTALDVTVQKAILDLMRSLRDENGLSMLFISHDLGVISEICDRVAVMYQGNVVESGTVQEIMTDPKHPYTKGLLASRPSLHQKVHHLPTVQDFLEDHLVKIAPRVMTDLETADRRKRLYAPEPLLKVENLSVQFPAQKNWLGTPIRWKQAVDQVSFDVFEGETFGLAGESGCGKTTLGRAIARLTPAHAGKVWYRNQELSAYSEPEFRPFRKEIQVIFQDPYASLNPRMRIGAAIQEPMEVHGLQANKQARKDKVFELLETVGLEAAQYNRYPHEFSGGQRQRICIARALALEPRFIICDEIVSALDVSVQATVLNLLFDLQTKFGLTYLFISHDLSVIHQMCDRLMVMDNGKVEAIGFPNELFAASDQPFVQRLVDAVPGKMFQYR
ncbi:MAG: ABC transporter ATP-binding protein [Saprospiraceae bacterium]|nr:ABC transporter ATP-binding protein [Saprospiraceae bacterium]